MEWIIMVLIACIALAFAHEINLTSKVQAEAALQINADWRIMMEYTTDDYGNAVRECAWCRYFIYSDDLGQEEYNGALFCSKECADNARMQDEEMANRPATVQPKQQPIDYDIDLDDVDVPF